MSVPNGGLVVVQLREGASGDGWEWVLAGIEDSTLELISDEFYADTPRVFAETGAGTHSFQLRAIGAGDVTVWFELRNPESDLPWDVLEYTIRIN